MASAIKITRRPANGVAGSPSSALSAQLFSNEADNLLYIGYGDDGTGKATSCKAFADMTYNPAQRVPAGGASGYILTKTGAGDFAMAWTAAPLAYTGGNGITVSGASIAINTSVVATQTDIALKAPLASPAFTGSPTVPTAANGTASTVAASTAFVENRITSLINGAPSTLDTFREIADQLASDESGAAALTTLVGTKMTKTANLSDLSDLSAARTNLGLGSMALQISSAVSITGGTMAGTTMSNCVVDGGTW